VTSDGSAFYSIDDVPEGGDYEIWGDDPGYNWPPGHRQEFDIMEDRTVNIIANSPV
jgi:hypothetical protein